jgi:hypothetical protein
MSEARKKWIVYVLTPLVSEAWAVRTITKIPELVVVVLVRCCEVRRRL